MKGKNFYIILIGITINPLLMACGNKQYIEQKAPVITYQDSLANSKKPKYSRNLIIYYDKSIGNNDLMKAVQEYGAELIYEYNSLSGIAIKIPEEISISEAMEFFKKVKGVTSVHRDQIIELDPIINDKL